MMFRTVKHYMDDNIIIITINYLGPSSSKQHNCNPKQSLSLLSSSSSDTFLLQLDVESQNRSLSYKIINETITKQLSTID